MNFWKIIRQLKAIEETGLFVVVSPFHGVAWRANIAWEGLTFLL